MGETVPIPQDSSDHKALEAWLQSQPQDVCVALAARAALRVFPLLGEELFDNGVQARWRLLLPCFRALQPPWLITCASSKGEHEALRDAANAAFSAAQAAAIGAGGSERARFVLMASTGANAAASNANRNPIATIGAAASGIFSAYAVDVAAGMVADADTYLNARALLETRLWPGVTPEVVEQSWLLVRDHLLTADEGWEVWTTWYDDRLNGAPVDVALETRRVIEPTRWDDGPAAVNDEIAEIIADHKARKAAEPRAQSATGQSIQALLDTPVLQTAYADFEVDADTATVRMVPMPGDVPVLADAKIALDWRSRLEGLAIQPLELIEHIRDARCNVPQALLEDLARYAHEAALGPDAVRPGVLDLYGRSLIAAGEIEDITAALGEYLGGTLNRIADAHRRLMRDYHAQVTSRLNAAPVTLPEDATPTAVADAVEAVSESLKQQPPGSLHATRDFTDLLDTQKEAFRAANARLDLTDDAAQRQIILDSIRADEARTLATISRFALRIRQAVGSNSKLAKRVGYVGSIVGLVDFVVFGRAAQLIQTIMRWLGLG